MLQTLLPLELRAEEGKKTEIVGYASVFNEETDMFFFREQIAPGAFTRTLREKPDILALWDHNTAHPIGRVSAGTLVLSEDERGLKSQISPPDTTTGRDAMELVRTGHVKGMSFGFRVIKEEWTIRKDGTDLRTIKDLDLYEVSVVTFPAYEGTSAQARKLIAPLSKRYFDAEEIHAEYRKRNLQRSHERLNNRIAWLEKLA